MKKISNQDTRQEGEPQPTPTTEPFGYSLRIRALATFLHWASLGAVLYLFIGTDAYWSAALPSMPGGYDIQGATLIVYLWAVVNTVFILSRHPENKFLAVSRYVVIGGNAIVFLFYLWFFAALPGAWFLPVWISVPLVIVCPVLTAAVLFNRCDIAWDQDRLAARLRLPAPKTALCIIGVMTFVIGLMAFGYWEYQKPVGRLPNLSGTILLGREKLAYSPRTGTVDTIPWGEEIEFARPSTTWDFLCFGRRGEVFCTNIYRGRGDVCNDEVHTIGCYVPFEDFIGYFPTWAENEVECSSLDYYYPTGDFLMRGEFGDSCGFFILRLNGKPDKMYTAEDFGREESEISSTKAHFIDSLNFLISTNGSCFTWNINDSTLIPLTDGQFRAISPDRKSFVTTRGETYDQTHFLIDISSGTETFLDVGRPRVWFIGFSPDSKYLVYSLATRGLVHYTERYYIYSLATGERFKLPLVRHYSDPIWISAEYDAIDSSRSEP